MAEEVKVQELSSREIQFLMREGQRWLLADTALFLSEILDMPQLMGSEREKLQEAREIVLHLKALEEERAQ